MEKIEASSVKFIKLGKAGKWEDYCIKNNVIVFELNNPNHDQCLLDEWDDIFVDLLQQSTKNTDKKKKQEATTIKNQAKDFYTSPGDVMWITFYKRKLYWCFAEDQVEERLIEPNNESVRVRKVKDNWRSTDIFGNDLFVQNLSGKLTMVQMFRGTICDVKEKEYLLQRINSIESEDILNAKYAFEMLVNKIKPLIFSLTWKDFEILVDLVFSNAGWQRVATLGGTEKDIDLDLLSPVSGRRAFVQVKSRSSQEELEEYINTFEAMKQYDEMYYVYHTTGLSLPVGCNQNIKLIGIDEIAKLTVNAGLTNWLITKSS